MKKITIATLYAILLFSLLSYISVMISLLRSTGNPSMKPVTNIGFPFNYYYQFWLSGSDSPNSGWVPINFILDAIIVWVIVLIAYFYLNRKKSS